MLELCFGDGVLLDNFKNMLIYYYHYY